MDQALSIGTSSIAFFGLYPESHSVVLLIVIVVHHAFCYVGYGVDLHTFSDGYAPYPIVTLS